jgi:hypothetical protein
MSKEYTVVFYERRRKKGQKPGSQLVPYYGPKGNALTRYADDDYGQGRAAGDMPDNGPIVACRTFSTKAEAEKAAKDLLDMGFHNVGVFTKVGEFAPAEPTWQEVE